ncbi:MAG: insulinase family protein [Chloroflexi bacterium]|nr:insulinase family protein [Chloroflexota bacterium]
MNDQPYHKSVLGNGLRVLTAAMPHTRSVTISIYVRVGSRYEEPAEAGVSHFLEHLLFKGTERRPTAQEISEVIERVGGVLNAGTDRELTVYWCKVARDHMGLGLDLLGDMLRHSRFDPEEVDKERRVVLEELASVQDAPPQWVDVLLDQVMWPGQPLGWDVAGTRESVAGFSREMALEYWRRHYGPGATVVSVAGDVEHERVVAAVDATMGSWAPIATPSWQPAVDGQAQPCLRLEHRRTEQAHLSLAVRGLSSVDPERFALDLLNVVLGEGMSSRLFVAVRERQGLAYDVHSYVSHYLDTGTVGVYAGVDPKRASSALGSIMEQLARIRDGVEEDELTKAKEFSKGRMFLRLEDTRNVSGWMGAQESLLNEIKTVDEVAAAIDAVQLEDIVRVARRLFVTDKLNLALVGPLRGEGRFLSLLKF